MNKKQKSNNNLISIKNIFQYAVTVVLNYEEIKKDRQKVTKTKPFTNKYDWEGVNCPSEKDDQKKIEKNNVTIAHDVLYAKNEKYILLIFQNITQILKNQLFF